MDQWRDLYSPAGSSMEVYMRRSPVRGAVEPPRTESAMEPNWSPSSLAFGSPSGTVEDGVRLRPVDCLAASGDEPMSVSEVAREVGVWTPIPLGDVRGGIDTRPKYVMTPGGPVNHPPTNPFVAGSGRSWSPDEDVAEAWARQEAAQGEESLGDQTLVGDYGV